ncbi:MAG: DUF368 domain-containing protein [Eubacteriales bacterium]|nr:DUF368 domain-containing protein [Eubacteriales bacterium]
MEKRNSKDFFYRMLCGFFLGISIIAPGVSGSVMAVMMGIYDQLINIISNPFKNFKKNFKYLFPMGIGAVLSILIFLQLLNLLFEYYPVPAFNLFIALIAGSLPAVFKESNRDGFKKIYWLGTIGAFAFAFTIGMMAKNNISVNAESQNFIYLTVCGAIAGMTGMIPGMSVSMMLMMLGVYEPLLKAASGFDIMTIAPVGAAFVIGMILFSNLTKYIFNKYHSFGYFMVFGFMIGSLVSIFPGLPEGQLNWILSVVTIIIGLTISLIFQKLGKKFNAEGIKP